jgi:hypothetical protein
MARSFIRVAANAREVQTTTIGNFNGVDLSSPTLQANTSRSVELLNFVKRQKFNQKRFGIHQVLSNDEVSVSNEQYSKIHGVWSFIDSSNTERVVAHVDDHFVLFTGLGSDKSYFNINQNYNTNWIKDIWTTSSSGPIPMIMEVGPEENSFGFASDGYLYVLGGSRYIRFLYSGESNSIVAEDLKDNYYSTYIPLTRNSVVPTGSLVEGLSQAYDDVNMLTQWKKNSLITGTFGAALSNNPFNSSGYTEFKLDSKVNPKTLNDLNNSVLTLSYLKTNATALINADYTSALTWTTNVITIGPSTPSEVQFNDFIFAKVAYRSGNPGRDYNIKDIAVRLKYKLDTFGSFSYFTTPYFKSDGTGGLILTNTADSTAYNPTDATAYKYTIDYRPAISGGYLTSTANTDVYTITNLASTQGYIEVPIKLFLKYINSFGGVYTFTLTRNLRIPIQSDAEFLAYQTKIDINATAQNVTTHELVFKNGATSIAKLYFGSKDEPAKLHLYYVGGIDYENPSVGTPNMYITFPNWVPGYSERVTGCKFGKLWGYNGARNRLFISGNETFKNIVYHSTQVNFYTKLTSDTIENLNNDFTYFSDLDYNIMGTDNSRVNALEVLANGNLLVLKEENSFEASAYTIKASLTKALAFDGSAVKAGDGTTDLQEEIYLANIGNQGHGGINPLAVANIDSNTLFLSNVGIRSFILSENLPVEETRSLPASTLIDKKLLQDKDYFSNAIMYSFGEYLYLALNGTIYVASEQYLASDIGPKEYEWWLLKGYEYSENNVNNYANIDVRNFFSYDGELYFYNALGLFKIKENQFVDKETTFFAEGYITYTYNAYTPATNNGVLSINSAITPLVTLDKYIAFRYETYNFIGHLNAWITAINGYNFGVVVSTANSSEIVVGKKFRVMAAGSTIKGNYYIISEIGPTQLVSGTTYQFIKFTDLNGNIVTSTTGWGWGGPVNIATVIPAGTELKIKTINQVNNEITVFGDYEETLRFTYLHGETPNREFYVVERDNVSCYYITSPFNFGSITLLKTIDKFILSNDSRSDSYIEIEYLAANNTNQFQTVGSVTNSEMFLNDLSFNYLYFGSSILPIPFAIRANRRNIHSIMFKFKNNRDTNACLTNLTMLYYLTKKVR